MGILFCSFECQTEKSLSLDINKRREEKVRTGGLKLKGNDRN